MRQAVRQDQTERPMLARAGGQGPFFALLTIALLSLLLAGVGIADGLYKLASAGRNAERGYLIISAAEDVLSIARDSETGQRGFLLTGESRFLEPYNAAAVRAPAAWSKLERLTSGSRRTTVVQMRRTFLEKQAINARSISLVRQQGLGSARAYVANGEGKVRMDLLRREVADFVATERANLRMLEQQNDRVYRDAILQIIIGSIALVFTGGLLFAAIRRARMAAGQNAALAASAHQRFQATFEQAAMGMVHMTPLGDPIIVNDALCSMTGYSREEILRAHPADRAHPTRLLMDLNLRRTFLAGRAQDSQSEYWTETKSGRPLCISMLVHIVKAPDSRVAFFSALVSNVTDLREAEQSLADSQERLRRLQDELAHIGRVNDLGEMAAAIAHEVNQPLTAIANYMSAGRRLAKALPDDAKEIENLMGLVADQALRAGKIVKRMRSFVERRDEVRSPEPLVPLIESAIDLAQMGIDKMRITITHVVNPNWCIVHVDAIQIQQVLMILLRNAIEAFGKPRGRKQLKITITKELSEDRKTVSVYVADNGYGLSDDIAANIFQPFVTSKPGNMGMGLPIAKRLVEQHDGRLTLIKRHEGATFRIDLPVIAVGPAPGNGPPRAL